MTPDQRQACATLAMVLLEDRQPNLQELLLLELAFFEDRKVLKHMLSQLEEPEPETAAWLAALSGSQELFELAWARCQPRLDLEPTVMLDDEGQQILVTWRPGMQGFWEYAADLCRPPLTTAALDFLYPAYYQGPLYGVLPQLILSGDEVWIARVLTDYQHNPHLLLEVLDDQEELVPRTKSYQLRIAGMMVCQRNDLEALRSLLPLLKVESLNSFGLSTFIWSLLSARPELLELFLETLPQHAHQVLSMAAAGRGMAGYPADYPHAIELALPQLQPQRCPLNTEQLRDAFFVLVAKQRFNDALNLIELYQGDPEAMVFSKCVRALMIPWPTREADFQRLLAEAQARGWTERLEALRAGLAEPQLAHFWQLHH